MKNSTLSLLVAVLAMIGSVALYAKSRAPHPPTQEEANLAGPLVMNGAKYDDLPRLAEEYEAHPPARHDSRTGNLVQDIASLKEDTQRDAIVILAKMRRENQAAYARPWRIYASYAAIFAAFCVVLSVVSRLSQRRAQEEPPAA